VAADGICKGPCNSRWRRAQDDYRRAVGEWQEQMAARNPGDPEPERPAEPEIRAWEGSPWFCPRCQAQIRREMAELDDVASIVTAFADGHRVSTEAAGKVSGSKATPSPSPALDAIDELASVLRGWESALRGTEPAARRGLLAQEITTTVAWLTSHFDAMITHPDFGGDFGAEISQWYRSLCQRSKAGTGRSRKPMPCSRCHHLSLYQEDGAKYVECSRKAECGRLMTISEYEAEFDEWQQEREKAKEKLARAS